MKKTPFKKPATSGFALVIALSLMAFVLVLLLSITTLVRVETGASVASLSRMQAEQNALLALHIAVGELQQSVGPDQRVTARADILDSDPDTLAVDDVANPYWVGAFQSVEAGNEQQGLEALRNWSTDRTAADRVSWLVSSRQDLSEGSVDPVTTDAATINGGAGNVVRLATFQDEAGNDLFVEAGKVDVTGANDSLSGRFGWWATDENLKFRINTTAETTVLSGQPFDARSSMQAAMRSNASIIPELSSYDVTDAAQQAKVRRSHRAGDFALTDATWETWLGEHSDAYSMVSQSIPVDVTQGRLKEDLTVYLESDSSGLLDADNIIRGEADDVNYLGRLTSLNSSLDYDAAKFPKFGLLKTWFQRGLALNGFAGGTLPTPEPHLPDSHGLHPVILRTAVYFGISYQVEPGGTTVRPVYLVYPKFVLWNPHNVPITPAKYVVQVRAMTTLNTQINVGGSNYGARNIIQGFNYQGNAGNAGNSFAHLNLANSASVIGLQRDPEDNYPYLTFVIENDGFAPGETLLYTAADKGSSSEYVDTDIDGVPADFQNHNILINENEDVFGFYTMPASGVLTAVPNNAGDPIPVTNSGDVLQAALYFKDSAYQSPVGRAEPSLSSKLYRFDGAGDTELLEFIDFDNGSVAETNVDWENVNADGSTEGWSHLYDPLADFQQYRSIDSIMADRFLANFHRGHGYFINPMANPGGSNRARMLARHNLASGRKTGLDPLVSSSSMGRIHADSIPTSNWFNGPPFPTDVPADFKYAGVEMDGFDTPGAYGLLTVSDDFTLGNTVYPLYDQVRGSDRLLSLGFLKNVNFSQFEWQPSFSFGLSEAHTHIARDTVQETHGGTQYTDLSYLLNESLWDRFFLSTIPQTGDFAASRELVLPNIRHRLVPTVSGAFPAESELRSSSVAFEQVAASIMVEGGFNVNSTSVEAWRLFLGSQLGVSVESSDTAASNDSTRVPLSARAYPLIAEVTDSVRDAEAWSAVRSLSANDINLLANAMVEEVKRRGPFLSLGDFVNRRLVSDGATPEDDMLGLKGALQAAIDKVSTSVSGAINDAYFQEPGVAVSTSDAPANSRYPEHESGMPDGLEGSRMFGVPGFLTQGDVLSALAPALTVRGDTFTIRAYGEAVEGVSNETSKAWCEAVVQRTAAPVDAGDSIVQPVGRFGRSYKIISMRWLSEDEVI